MSTCFMSQRSKNILHKSFYRANLIFTFRRIIKYVLYGLIERNGTKTDPNIERTIVGTFN